MKTLETTISKWFMDKMNLSLDNKQLKALCRQISSDQPLRLYGVVRSFKMEVHNKNGAWYEIVLAKTVNEATKKVQNKYTDNTYISLVSEYDEPIF